MCCEQRHRNLQQTIDLYPDALVEAVKHTYVVGGQSQKSKANYHISLSSDELEGSIRSSHRQEYRDRPGISESVNSNDRQGIYFKIEHKRKSLEQLYHPVAGVYQRQPNSNNKFESYIF